MNNDFEGGGCDPEGRWWEKVWEEEDKRCASAKAEAAHERKRRIEQADEGEKKKGVVRRPENAVVIPTEQDSSTGISFKEFLMLGIVESQRPSSAETGASTAETGNSSGGEQESDAGLKKWFKKKLGV